jgi:hypothetical protein
VMNSSGSVSHVTYEFFVVIPYIVNSFISSVCTEDMSILVMLM